MGTTNWRTCVYRRNGARCPRLPCLRVFSLAVHGPGQVRLLPGRSSAGVVLQSNSARHRRHAFDELPLHPDRHSGNEPAGNVADWSGEYASAVLLASGAEVEAGATVVQFIARYGLQL